MSQINVAWYVLGVKKIYFGSTQPVIVFSLMRYNLTTFEPASIQIFGLSFPALII